MKDSSLENRKHIGIMEGEIPGKRIKIYEVSFFDHKRIMFPFYQLIEATTAYSSCQASYTSVWRKIPKLHRVGNELDKHDKWSLIDYAATIFIFFDSKRHLNTQKWWHDNLDKHMVIAYPHYLTCAEQYTWVTMNGAIAMIGYVPEVVYGGLMETGSKKAFQSHKRLEEGCKALTEWVEAQNSPQSKAKPYANTIYLFNEDMKQYLLLECSRLVKEHNES